jgi:putative cell wall-binding protein
MKSKKILSLFLSLVLVFTALVFVPNHKAYAANKVQRIEGADRYKTAIAISKSAWVKSDNVVIATGSNFPDALSASPLAKQLDSPILLVGKQLDKDVENEITRLEAKKAYIVGGEDVVSKDISKQLEGKGLEVIRLAGHDRYGTAFEIANHMAENFEISGQIAVATGENFPDALSIAPIAAACNMPILLTNKSYLSDSVIKYLDSHKTTKSYVIGGKDVIYDKAIEKLPNAERVYGDDRYKTNIAILNKFSDKLNYEKTYIATGLDFPDALTGSALAPKTNSPIILVDKKLSIPQRDFIDIKSSTIKEMDILGGERVVPNTILTNNVYGNMQGNITNYGLVAEQGDWIYYSNNGLYKINKNGTGKKQVSSDQALFVNVVGDWVYYLKVSEDENESNKIYKVRTDGTGKTKVVDDICFYVTVAGDWIYYMNATSPKGEGIYKVRTDGKLNTKLVSANFAYDISVSGDWLYYSLGEFYDDVQSEINRIKIDGTSKQNIYNCDDLDGGFMGTIVSGDWVYFMDAKPNDTQDDLFYRIYKTKKDGSGKAEMVLEDQVLDYNVYDGWIYYLSDEENPELYKVKIDGTEKTKLNTSGTALINIAGDWIYYISQNDDNLYRVKIDGTGNQIVK